MSNFKLPSVLYELPTDDELKSFGYKGFKLKLARKLTNSCFMKTRLAEAQNWKCCYCGCEMNNIPNHRRQATIEHVVPKFLGGSDLWENLVSACAKCNNERGHAEIVYKNGVVSFGGKHPVPGLKSKKQLRKEKKSDHYIERMIKLSKKDFKLNNLIGNFDQWLKTIGISTTEKEKLKNYAIEHQLVRI